MGIFDIFKRSKTKYSGDFKPYDINTWSYRSFDGNALNIDLVRACVDALARNIAKMSLRPIVMNKDGQQLTIFQTLLKFLNIQISI